MSLISSKMDDLTYPEYASKIYQINGQFSFNDDIDPSTPPRIIGNWPYKSLKAFLGFGAPGSYRIRIQSKRIKLIWEKWEFLHEGMSIQRWQV